MYARHAGTYPRDPSPHFNDLPVTFRVSRQEIQVRVAYHIKKTNAKPVAMDMDLLQYQFHQYQKYKNSLLSPRYGNCR
jgi:hypothetical protein